MDSLLAVLGIAVAALLMVAVGVACWEMSGQRTRALRLPPPATPRVQRVDLEIEPLVAPPAPSTTTADEQVVRRVLLGDAMARMAMADPGTKSRAWTETLPLPSTGRPPRPAPTEAERSGGI